MTQRSASIEIAEHYRKYKQIRKAAGNPVRETFELNGQVIENYVGVPVKLLNKLLKEKHK